MTIFHVKGKRILTTIELTERPSFYIWSRLCYTVLSVVCLSVTYVL